MPKNNEAQFVPLPFWSSWFMKCSPSFVLGKLSYEKAPLNLGCLSK